MKWKNLYKPNATGSDGGIIIADEEYRSACRVTMERVPGHHAITCAVYGAMVHTVFCDETEAQNTYNAIKRELQDFIDRPATPREELEFYGNFTAKFQ